MKRILIVDDEAFIVEVLRDLLQESVAMPDLECGGSPHDGVQLFVAQSNRCRHGGPYATCLRSAAAIAGIGSG